MNDSLAAFIQAATVPPEAHQSGTLDRAEAILAAHPEVATGSIHTAALLGDEQTVRRFLALDATGATSKGGPHGWDPLTHLCFSQYLRLDRTRTGGFLRTATALLDAGASARTGFFDPSHRPDPVFESVLYGAAGVAHDPELTSLLLDRGADPNDGETPYHAPETYDNRALKALVESGKLAPDSLSTMLLRKADWHDVGGITWLLEHGAEPNRMTPWHKTALHQAIQRDNALEIIEVFMDHGANPRLMSAGASAVAMAARRGRGDVLIAFETRGVEVDLRGLDRLLAACAKNDGEGVKAAVASEPQLVSEVDAAAGKVLAEFAGNGNTDGLRHLLDLGVNLMARYKEGDGYYGIARGSTALHVAAWRARHATVRFLIDRGASVEVLDGKGQTPLALAVRACVASYWTERRSPDSVEALLRAGSSATGADFPSGYAEVDELLRRFGRSG